MRFSESRMRTRVALTSAMAAFCLAAQASLFPGTLLAQADSVSRQISGFVGNRFTNQPIVGVLVTLDSIGASVITDETGAFAFDDVPAGVRHLLLERIGFRTLRLRVETPLNRPVRLYMAPVAVPLEPLTARIERVRTQLDNRLRAVPLVTQVATMAELHASGLYRPSAYLERMNVWVTWCDSPGAPRGCVSVYGRRVQPRIFLNDLPIGGGLGVLNTVPIPKLCRIEVLDHGALILAYTCEFIARVASGKQTLLPTLLFTKQR